MGVAPKDRLAVALDTADWEEFRDWCSFFGPRVGVLKVGLQAYLSWGRSAVEEAQRAGGAVFLDLKLHDIPNTVAGAVASLRDAGVDYVTVHAAGGRAMLEAAVESAADLRILAVTLLTHLGSDDLRELDLPGDGLSRVLRWAELARDVGVAGVVSSPLEAAALRSACPSPFLLVTPGIRPAGSEAADQTRVATPAEALRAGADLLVVGRPLTRAADREAALHRVLAELA